MAYVNLKQIWHHHKDFYINVAGLSARRQGLVAMFVVRWLKKDWISSNFVLKNSARVTPYNLQFTGFLPVPQRLSEFRSGQTANSIHGSWMQWEGVGPFVLMSQWYPTCHRFWATAIRRGQRLGQGGNLEAPDLTDSIQKSSPLPFSSSLVHFLSGCLVPSKSYPLPRCSTWFADCFWAVIASVTCISNWP